MKKMDKRENNNSNGIPMISKKSTNKKMSKKNKHLKRNQPQRKLS